jgi:L-ribulose-5-phosphate 3-epimerase
MVRGGVAGASPSDGSQPLLALARPDSRLKSGPGPNSPRIPSDRPSSGAWKRLRQASVCPEWLGAGPLEHGHCLAGYPAVMALLLAYNTNGLCHHRPADALSLLADLGYQGVALTPDVGPLDPLGDWRAECERLRALAERRGLALSVESGARYLLDPRHKHGPALLDGDPLARRKRLDLLKRHLDMAAALGALGLSIWSGAAPGGLRGDPIDGNEVASAAARPPVAQGASNRALRGEAGSPIRAARSADAPAEIERCLELLTVALRELLAYAAERGVPLWFEPEPGMFIERPAGYRLLCERLGSAGPQLGLTLDVGHCHCTQDLPVARIIDEFAPRLRHVHLADIRGREHVHLPFGQGDLDLPAVVAALQRVGFEGLCAVELSRDSHRGPSAAQDALAALRAAGA